MDKITDTSKSTYSSDTLKRLLELIADAKVAMLTTVEKEGYLRSRPMMTQDSEFEGALWFFSRDHDGKAEEVMEDPRVNLSYAMPDKNTYVSVSGLAEIVKDGDKVRELWNPLYKAWFPDGPDDPHLALLKVYVEKAEYWDAPSSRFVELLGFAKTLLTGQAYHQDDKHEKIVFDSSPGSGVQAGAGA